VPSTSTAPRPGFPLPVIGFLLVAAGVATLFGFYLFAGVDEPPGFGASLEDATMPEGGGVPILPSSLPPSIGPVPPPSPSFPAARTGGTSGAVEPGLRAPFGEDFSDPAHVKAKLRAALAAHDWARVADLLGIHDGALDPDVLDALVQALYDPAQAARAAGAWARVRDPKALRVLLPRVSVARDDLATWTAVLRVVTSAAAVPGADRGAAVATLHRLVDGTPQDVVVLQSIARIGGLEALDAFIDLARRPNGAIRVPDHVRADLDLRQDKEAGRRLSEALASPDATPDALVALSDLAFVGPGAEAVVPALLALDVEGRPQEVREAVFSALTRVGDDRGYEHLLAVAQDPKRDVGQVAGTALAGAQSASPAARARLVEAARTTTDDGLRLSLAHGLGSLREPSALPLLTEWVGSGSETVRSTSVAALGKYGPRAAESVEALGHAYGSGDVGLRSQVAVTLAAIGTPEARRLLEQARASETSPTVKKVVESALRNLEARRSP
jgi:HEAT repeat protein